VEYYVENVKVLTKDEVLNTDARKTLVTFEPLGGVGSMMPWNFPYWQDLQLLH
jgi:succinate-semialdehyde dehydrogenase/glutarate-semialdehyde dehydrogenase/succinyl-CoA reductase